MANLRIFRTCTISRNGDLVHRIYLRVVVPDVSVPAGTQFRWLNWLGHILIKSVKLHDRKSNLTKTSVASLCNEATITNCGDTFRALSTKVCCKRNNWQREYSGIVKILKIRQSASKLGINALVVQRIDVIGSSYDLRYILVPYQIG